MTQNCLDRSSPHWLSRQLELVDHVRHHAPDVDVLVLRDVDFRIVWILWHKQNSSIAPDESFDRQLAIQGCDDHLVVAWSDDPVDDQKISVKDARLDHGLTADSQEERGRLMSDQMLMEVEWAFHAVLGGGGESRLNGTEEQGAERALPGSRKIVR